MASTSELCEIIANLGGDPEALSDKLSKTLEDEIIRILGCGSCLHLNANQISCDQTTVGAKLDSLDQRVPTSEEVLEAIQNMTAVQVAAVKRKLSIK